MAHVRLILPFILTLAGCDFEHRVRRWLSDPGERNATGRTPTEPLDSRLRESEPNNTEGTASAFVLDSELRVVEGELAADDQVDWITISAPKESGRFELTIEPDDGLDVGVKVASQSGAESEFDNAKDHGVERLRNVVLKSGYTFAVTRVSGNGRFMVRAKRLSDSAKRESEPNDTLFDANIIERGVTEGSADQADDRDVYLVDLPGTSTLRFRALEHSDQVVTFHKRDYKMNAQKTSPSGWPTVRREIPKGGTLEIPTLGGHFLMSVATVGPISSGAYRIEFTEHSVEGSVEKEPNDVVHQIVEVAGDAPTQLQGYFDSELDTDKFSVDWRVGDMPTQGGEHGKRTPQAFVATVEPNSSEMRVGIVAGTDNRVGLAGKPVVACSIELGEPFAVRRVDGPVGRDVAYRVRIEPAGDREPNNDIARSEPLELGRKKGVLSAGDVDVVRMQIGAGDATIKMAGALAFRAELLDADGGAIAIAKNGRISANLPAGEYYLRLTSESTQCTDYEVTLEAAPHVDSRSD